MIPIIIEVTACLIAVLCGVIGLFFSYDQEMIYLSTLSAALLFNVFVYLSCLSEMLQIKRPSKVRVLTCQVLNKSIYVIFMAQLIAAIFMVK